MIICHNLTVCGGKMLKPTTDIYCGIYNSRVIRGSAKESRERTVEFFEIELFHEKLGISHINGKPYQTERGMLLISKPGQKRYSIFPVKCSFIRLFTDGLDPELSRVIGTLPDISYIKKPSDAEHLLGLFARLGSLFTEDPDIHTSVRINALFYEILGEILKLLGVAKEQKAPLIPLRCVREAYEYINENFTGCCTLQKLADAVNVTPNYLHTAFTSSIGITPLEYVTKKRIERAKQLIMIGEYSMIEIALTVGFCSQSHFNKVFRQKTGMTPAEYKKDLMMKYQAEQFAEIDV